jgi:rare lipoprotein A (peptidoglycan hydrolase)
VFVSPLLLLQQGSAHETGVATALNRVALHRALSDPALFNGALPSQLVRYQAAPAKTATPPPVTPTTVAPTTTATTSTPTPSYREAATTLTPTTAAPTVTPPTVTALRAPAVISSGNSERGQATWYAAAPPGRCASPTLPFGTVLTITNVATGATTTCTVDDREQAGYSRVVDLSPSGFAQLAEPSQGVVDVSISW